MPSNQSSVRWLPTLATAALSLVVCDERVRTATDSGPRV
jgi:hypothetical protein